MKKLSEKERAREDGLRDHFLTLSPREQGQAYSRLRRRIIQYRELHNREEGKIVAELAANLDLNALQTGRLQMIVRDSNKRLKEAIREYDANSPALHPAERVEAIPQDEA